MRTFIEDLRDRWADRSRRIKVAKIRRVFEREGGLIAGTLTSTHRLVCDHPGRCAVGALLVAAGVTDTHLWDGITTVRYKLLEKVYGLYAAQVDGVIYANDSRESKPIWEDCGIHTRPVEKVRVCVVNDKIGKLASA